MGRAAPRRVRIGRASPARQQNKCACRRSARPSIGDGREHKDTTRAQQRAAGTKKTALFDIVRCERCVRRACARLIGIARVASLSCPGRASVSERRAGTQGLPGKIDGELKRPVVSPLGPRKSGLPDLRRLTANLGQARDRCLASLARDTRSVPEFVRGWQRPLGQTNPRCRTATNARRGRQRCCRSPTRPCARFPTAASRSNAWSRAGRRA